MKRQSEHHKSMIMIGSMRENNRAARAARFLVKFFYVVYQITTWNFHFWGSFILWLCVWKPFVQKKAKVPTLYNVNLHGIIAKHLTSRKVLYLCGAFIAAAGHFFELAQVFLRYRHHRTRGRKYNVPEFRSWYCSLSLIHAYLHWVILLIFGILFRTFLDNSSVKVWAEEITSVSEDSWNLSIPGCLASKCNVEVSVTRWVIWKKQQRETCHERAENSTRERLC